MDEENICLLHDRRLSSLFFCFRKCESINQHLLSLCVERLVNGRSVAASQLCNVIWCVRRSSVLTGPGRRILEPSSGASAPSSTPGSAIRLIRSAATHSDNVRSERPLNGALMSHPHGNEAPHPLPRCRRLLEEFRQSTSMARWKPFKPGTGPARRGKSPRPFPSNFGKVLRPRRPLTPCEALRENASSAGSDRQASPFPLSATWKCTIRRKTVLHQRERRRRERATRSV